MSVSQVVASGTQDAPDAATRYTSLSGSIALNATEANVEQPVRDAGVFSKLYTYVAANSVNASSTITLRKSRADTALLVTYTTLLTGILENTSDTVTFAATDEADWEITCPSVSGSKIMTVNVIAVQFAPTTSTNCVSFMALGFSASFSTASTTSYMPPAGSSAYNSTEINSKFRMRVAAVAQDFYVLVTANARTTNTVFGTRKNGAAGGQSVTFTNTLTGALEDTSGTDTLAAGDDYNYFITTLTGAQTITVTLVSTSLVSTASDFFNLTAFSSGLGIAFNSTLYNAIGSYFFTSVTELNTQVLARFTWTAKELGAYVSLNTIATSASTITLRDNTANGNQVLSYAAAETGLKNDSTHTDDITLDTDEVNYKIVTPNTSGTLTITWIGIVGTTSTSTPLTITVADDAFNLSDSLTNLGHGHLFTDDLKLWDERQDLGHGLIFADDAFNLSDDKVVALGIEVIPFTDDLNNWNDVVALLVFGNIEVVVSDDSLNLADAFTGLGYGNSLVDDLNNLSDAIEKIGYGLLLSDDMNLLLDAIALSISYNLSASDDANNFADTLTNLGYGNLLSDTLFDGAAGFQSDAFQNSAFQAGFGLADEINIILGYLKTLVDDVNSWGDAIVTNLASPGGVDITVVSSDNLNNWLDQIATLMTHLVVLTDSINNWLDEIKLIQSYEIAQSDSINNLADAIEIINRLLVAFSDDLNSWNDLTSLNVGQFLQFSDDLNNWSDAISTQLLTSSALSKTLSDDLNLWKDFIIVSTAIQKAALYSYYRRYLNDVKVLDTGGIPAPILFENYKPAFNLYVRAYLNDSPSFSSFAKQDSLNYWQDSVSVV